MFFDCQRVLEKAKVLKCYFDPLIYLIYFSVKSSRIVVKILCDCLKFNYHQKFRHLFSNSSQESTGY